MLALFKVSFAKDAAAFCSENVLAADGLSAAQVANDEVQRQYKKEKLIVSSIEMLGIVTLEADRNA